ncbi:uncharacterized protein A4U43_C06F14070 [Asparagus officinalis]|uniref:Uncharacterized protein n=1 Tax=Asparagus officinalis TaxID=4686 RepID=A0A5P1ELT6_ASPOF|nr:uncharacterized protein A4U43_C06F14070 [Asparagus officinalis]
MADSSLKLGLNGSTVSRPPTRTRPMDFSDWIYIERGRAVKSRRRPRQEEDGRIIGRRLSPDRHAPALFRRTNRRRGGSCLRGLAAEERTGEGGRRWVCVGDRAAGGS